ncbi:hypothetical protein XPA_007972 [Xanthoria parietina]
MHLPPTSVLIAAAISLLLKGSRARPPPLNPTLPRVEAAQLNKRGPPSTTSLPPYPMHTDPADAFRRPPIDPWFPHHPDHRYSPDFNPATCARHTDGGDNAGDYWGWQNVPKAFPTVGQFIWSSMDCANYFSAVGNGWYDGGSIGGHEDQKIVPGRDWVRPESFDYKVGWGDYKEEDKDKDYTAWTESPREWREGDQEVRNEDGGFVIGGGREGEEKEW